MRLLASSHELRFPEVDSFIENNGGGQNLLKKFLRTPRWKTNTIIIEFDLLVEPYK